MNSNFITFIYIARNIKNDNEFSFEFEIYQINNCKYCYVKRNELTALYKAGNYNSKNIPSFI